MKILITGASGFCGRYLVDYFLNADYEIVAVSRDFSSEQLGRWNDVECLSWDLRTPLPYFKDVDCIVHTDQNSRQPLYLLDELCDASSLHRQFYP